MAHKRTYTLYRKTKTKILNITTSIVLVVSTVASAVPLVIASRALADNGVTTVTESNKQGWQVLQNSKNTGQESFVADPNAPLGKGALQLSTPDGSGEIMYDRNAATLVSPTDINVSYATKRLAGDADAAPSYVLGISPTGTDSSDANEIYAFYEPTYDSRNAGANYDNWNTWHVDQSAKFWSFSSVGSKGGAGGSNMFTMADVVTAFPNAKVNEYTINLGSGNPGWSVLIDDVVTPEATYDFEPSAPAAPVDLKFSQNNQDLPCDTTVNSIFNNKVELVWNAGSNDSASYRTLITYPDGTTKWAYTDTRNVWIGNQAAYGYDNGFGEHGNGVYTYEVQARNANNLWSPSATCTLSYDTSAPTVSFTTPANNAFLNGTFQVTVTAHDNLGFNFVTADVRTKDNPDSGKNPNNWRANCTSGKVTNSVTDNTGVTETYTCDVNTSALNDGETYTLRTYAQDKAGNWSRTAYQLFTIDRQLPTVQITSPLTAVNNRTVTIKGSATDNADFNYYYCYVTLPGSSEVGVRDPSCNTTWHSVSNGVLGAVDLAGVPDGNYEAHLVAYDKAGNHSDLNYAVPFALDTTGPTVAITAPTSGQVVSYAKNSVLDVRGSVTDSHPDHYYLHISGPNGYSAGPGTVPDANAFSNIKLFTWNLKGLASGDYVIDLEARDSLGNKDANSTQQIHVTVDNTAPDAPTLVSPDNNAFLKGASVTQSWSDASNDVDHFVYESYNDAKANAASLRWSQDYPAGTTSKTATNVPDKTTYWWRVMAVDKAGNSSSWSELRKITVDDTAPTAPVASLNAGKYVGPRLVSLSSTDANGSPDIYYTTDGSTPSDQSTPYTGAILVSSDTTLKAIAYDAAGNASSVLSASYTITQPIELIGGLGGPGSQLPTPPAPSLVRTFAAAVSTPSLQGQGNTGETGDGSHAVLGASTTTPNNTGEVKGASTGHNDSTQNANDTKSANFLGLGWWWLAVLAVVAALVFAVLRRPSGEGKDYS